MKEKIKKIAEALADSDVGLWIKKEYYKPFFDLIKPKNQLQEGTVTWALILLEMFYTTQAIRYGFLQDDYEELITEYYKCIFERSKKKFVLKKEMLDREGFIKIVESTHLRYHIILLQHEKDKLGPHFSVCEDTMEELSKEMDLDTGIKMQLQLDLVAIAMLHWNSKTDLLRDIINILDGG